MLMMIQVNYHSAWTPPGMYDQQKDELVVTGEPSQTTHDHNRNTEVKDILQDAEHIAAEFRQMFTEKEIALMNLDEQLFLWFTAHDWDKDNTMDGLELYKALSHDHNYHHDDEDETGSREPPPDPSHDPMQHTPPAERQRFRRTEKIVDKLLAEDDFNTDGKIDFPEFLSAYRAGRLDGIKVKRA